MTAGAHGEVRAAIVSVGTEVVGGDQVDTNAAWLAGRLRTLGARPVLTLAVGDQDAELVDALQVAVARADVVVVGGGLGPTNDDRTRDAIAVVADVELERREDLVAAIRARYAAGGRTMPASNARQGDIPRGGVPFPARGTAPGFSLDVGATTIHALPGVPWELRAMFDDHVADQVLRAAGGRVLVTRVVHTTGVGESDLAAALAQVERAAIGEGLDLAWLASGRGVQVKVSGAGTDHDAVVAGVDAVVDRVVEVVGSAVVGIDGAGLEVGVVRGLEVAGLTVATAESATGGLVAQRLTAVPGASAVVKGGLVVYGTATKVDVAGIDPALLEAHPPVSEPVTAALAVAARDRYDADIGVATTGVAGPASQDGVAVGTIVWAVADATRVEVWQRVVNGDRELVRDRLATAAIDAVRRRLPAPAVD